MRYAITKISKDTLKKALNLRADIDIQMVSQDIETDMVVIRMASQSFCLTPDGGVTRTVPLEEIQKNVFVPNEWQKQAIQRIKRNTPTSRGGLTVIDGKRRCGKTKLAIELLKMFDNSNSLILVPSTGYKESIIREYGIPEKLVRVVSGRVEDRIRDRCDYIIVDEYQNVSMEHLGYINPFNLICLGTPTWLDDGGEGYIKLPPLD